VLACRLQHVSPTFRDYVTEQLQLYKNATSPTDSSTAAATAATDAASNRRTALMSRLALEGSNSINKSNGDMAAIATSPYKLAQQLSDASQYRQSEVVSSFSGSSSNLTAAAVAAHTAATSATSATTGLSEPSQLSDIKSRLQRYQKPLAHIDGNTTAVAAGVASQHQSTAAAVAAPKQQQQQAQVASTAATLKERLARLTKAKTVL
jgi:hypothetical protein